MGDGRRKDGFGLTCGSIKYSVVSGPHAVPVVAVSCGDVGSTVGSEVLHSLGILMHRCLCFRPFYVLSPAFLSVLQAT